MFDQAKTLRQLVRETRLSPSAPSGVPPRLIVVAGGKGGVGTTTIAVNLAVALAGEGQRAVLADTSAVGADVARFCRVAECRTVADVLTGRCGAADALEPGPGGIEILAGVCGNSELWECEPPEHDRLIEELRGLGQRADFIVVDGGNSPTRMARRMWQAANPLLLVTTTELASILNAYAAIKTIAAGDDLLPLWTLVNRAPGAAAANDVHERLAVVCRRFLGVLCRAGGHVDAAVHVREPGDRSEPFILKSPSAVASDQVRLLARSLVDSQKKPRTTQDSEPRNRFQGAR